MWAVVSASRAPVVAWRTPEAARPRSWHTGWRGLPLWRSLTRRQMRVASRRHVSEEAEFGRPLCARVRRGQPHCRRVRRRRLHPGVPSVPRGERVLRRASAAEVLRGCPRPPANQQASRSRA